MPKARIVLVEDHSMVRQLFAHLVTRDLGLALAAECATASEGREAILREEPDLAVVDWALPDGRGPDLVRALAARVPNTGWLMISASEQGHFVREAASLGVQGFVMKRSDLPTFREAVNRILAGDTYYCPVSAQLLAARIVQEGAANGTALTAREREILSGFARGENPKAIAERLEMNVKTVQNHLTTLKDKLGLYEPAELVRYAIKHGYVEAP